MAGRRSVALRRPVSACSPGRSVGRGVGCRRMAQKRVARGSGAGRIAGARRAEAFKEGRGARGRVHNLDECAHKLAECRIFGILDKFVRAFVKVVNDWPAILPGCAAGHRGRPTPEQKSCQRIGFSSMGRIDPAAGSREPQVKALASRRLLRVHPKIRSFGGTFAWHRALTSPPSGFFRVPLALSRPGRERAHPGCRRVRRKAAQRAVGPNIKQCVLCIKPRSAMKGCAEGRKALRLMREALLYHRFTSKKWSITKPRHGDTLSGKYLPLIRYLSPLNSKYE